MKFKHGVNYLKEELEQELWEQKVTEKEDVLKVVGTINQIKMVSELSSQPFSRQIKER